LAKTKNNEIHYLDYSNSWQYRLSTKN